jgi:hypothetical protein
MEVFLDLNAAVGREPDQARQLSQNLLWNNILGLEGHSRGWISSRVQESVYVSSPGGT